MRPTPVDFVPPYYEGEKPPAFQLYVDDWLSDTEILCLSPAQEAGYMRLIQHCWKSNTVSIPNNSRALAVLSRLGDDWEELGDAILDFFFQHEGRLYNKRTLEEREKLEVRREAASFAGQKSARLRKEKQAENDAVDDPLQRKSNRAVESSLPIRCNETSTNGQRKPNRAVDDPLQRKGNISSSISSSVDQDQYADPEKVDRVASRRAHEPGRAAGPPPPTPRVSAGSKPGQALSQKPRERSTDIVPIGNVLAKLDIRAPVDDLFERLVQVAHDPPHYRAWWWTVFQRMDESGGLQVLFEAVDYAEKCQSGRDDLGRLLKPGGNIAGKCHAWLHRHGMSLPPRPK